MIVRVLFFVVGAFLVACGASSIRSSEVDNEGKFVDSVSSWCYNSYVWASVASYALACEINGTPNQYGIDW